MIDLVCALFVTAAGGQQPSADPIVIREGVAIGGVIAPGRLPFGKDSIQEQIVKGTWTMPKPGDSAPTARGGTAHWRKLTANANGEFPELPSGYFAASVDVPNDRVMILDAAGDSMVYVNGTPRAGDPYGYGYLHLPVKLHAGQNTFLFVVGRGGLHANLTSPRAPVQIETGDITDVDVVDGGPKNLLEGLVLLNSTDHDRQVDILSENEDGTVVTSTAKIPAMSLRKVPVKLEVPSGYLGARQHFKISCTVNGATDRATLTFVVKTPKQTHRETFISAIDGSLQYYGVNPSQAPSDKNALVLTLHGASVEGIGQAAAYASKDWCTLVAPTNRRPYGFDWEDIGRLDALEVLDIAKKQIPHDPQSVHLTGHSMGGHGTWSIGTLYPDLFASIAPSAGWISFWSYAGGFKPSTPTPVESEFLTAMSGSDTLSRVRNVLEEKVYILHGDKDDNVPVTEAREMKRVLTSIHADFEYHEQPGAGHWWGSPCVDWPGIFDQIRSSRLTERTSIDFTTPSPAISSHDQWVTILEQTHAMNTSHVAIDEHSGTTENVHALRLDRAIPNLTLDGQPLGRIARGTVLVNMDGTWKRKGLKAGEKTPSLSGPFKNVFQNHFAFVVGTHGTPEENRWAAEKARFDAEMFEYRGNGSVDIVTDRQYNPGWQRNAILYGNADTNGAWNSVLKNCPVQISRGKITAGSKILTGDTLGGLLVYPHRANGQWVLIGAVSGTGLEGMRTTDRLPVFTSGVAYPDWTILDADVLESGSKGVKGAGFFDNEWRLTDSDSAWNP